MPVPSVSVSPTFFFALGVGSLSSTLSVLTAQPLKNSVLSSAYMTVLEPYVFSNFHFHPSEIHLYAVVTVKHSNICFMAYYIFLNSSVNPHCPGENPKSYTCPSRPFQSPSTCSAPFFSLSSRGDFTPSSDQAVLLIL